MCQPARHSATPGGSLCLLISTCWGRQVWVLLKQTVGQNCSRCGLGGRGSTGTTQRRRPSWKARSTGPQRWDPGESGLPGKHREVAGGVSEEPDVLKTLSLPLEIETLRKANAGCHQQSEAGQTAVTEMERWVSWGKDTDPRARTPPTSCVSSGKILSLSVP